jgi:hypothetical protein
MSEKDFQEVQNANRETFKFFSYITQCMIVYMCYSVVRMTTSDPRAFDIVDIIITFSYLLMLFGVSISIKKSVDSQVREERMRSEFDFNFDEGGSVSSTIHKNISHEKELEIN